MARSATSTHLMGSGRYDRNSPPNIWLLMSRGSVLDTRVLRILSKCNDLFKCSNIGSALQHNPGNFPRPRTCGVTRDPIIVAASRIYSRRKAGSGWLLRSPRGYILRTLQHVVPQKNTWRRFSFYSIFIYILIHSVVFHCYVSSLSRFFFFRFPLRQVFPFSFVMSGASIMWTMNEHGRIPWGPVSKVQQFIKNHPTESCEENIGGSFSEYRKECFPPPE